MAARDIYKKLGLTADDAGVAYWDGLGLDDAELEKQLRYSAEQNGQLTTGATPGQDRSSAINSIYYQELGKLQADDAGMAYWTDEANRKGLTDAQLREAIRYSSGLSGKSVQQDLLADQGYAAYLRKMQFDESQIQSSLQAAQEAARRRIQGQAGQYDLQRKQGAQSIDTSYEARQNRGGQRLVDLNDQRTAVDFQQRSFEDGQRESIAGMERDAASRIADMRRQRAEEEVATRDRLTQRSVGM